MTHIPARGWISVFFSRLPVQQDIWHCRAKISLHLMVTCSQKNIRGSGGWGGGAIMRLALQALGPGLDRFERTASHKSIFTRQPRRGSWAGLIPRVPVINCNPSFLFRAHNNQRLGGSRPPQHHIYSNNNVTALSASAAYHCCNLMIINIQHMTVEGRRLAMIGWFSQQATG